MLIIDGSSLASRAYYSGSYPSFFNMMLRIMEDYNVDNEIIFVFDNDEDSFRKELYPDYKQHRVSKDNDERKAFIKKLYEALQKHDYAVALGSEGDDVIKYLVTQYDFPYVVTGDRDLFCLIDDCVLIWYGKSFNERGVVTEQTVIDTYGVDYFLLADYKGLVGDSSDGIPGVTGVGKKGAVKLIKEYGNGDLIFENPPVKGRYKFLRDLEAKNQYYLSKKLATIVEEETTVTGNTKYKPFGKVLKELR